MAALRLAEQEVDTDGEVMSEAAARRLTEKIRRAVESIDTMLLEAYEGRAHDALGYDTWDRYVKTEFGLSRSEGYRKLDQAKVTRELVNATGLSRGKDIAVSAKQATYLRGDLPTATAEVAAAVATGVPVTEAVKAAVKARTGPGGKVMPATSRETNGQAAPARRKLTDDEEIMAAGAELREQLLAWVDGIRTAVRYAPKANQPPETPAELLDELHVWVGTISSVVNIENLKPLRRLIGETYVLAKAIGGQGERKVLADLAGCTIGNIDFRVNAIRTGDFSA